MNDLTTAPVIYPNEPQARHDFAKELLQRYNDLRRWAADNWPNNAQPLSASDFIASERELLLLVGARLHSGGDASRPGAAQYRDSVPMPWP